MALKDLQAILGDGHRLPILGKIYTVPYASAEAGLRFGELTGVAAKFAEARQNGTEVVLDETDKVVLTDAQERDFYRDTLTDPVFDEMVADGVPFAHIKIAATYSLIHSVMGEEQAEAFWASGGKAPRPNRAARRTATQTRTAAAPTTKKPASRTGTTTRKVKPQTPGSPGKTSSSTGG